MTRSETIHFCNGVLAAIQQIYDKLQHDPIGLQDAANEAIYNNDIHGFSLIFNAKSGKFNPVAGQDINRQKPGLS